MKVTNKSIEDMEIITKNIDHLGIVAGTFDELSISEVLDEKLSKNRQHKVPHSTIVKAMVLNGLGYTERRLYLFPFFRGISEVKMELIEEEIVKVTNLREVPRKILSLMGKECEKYYN